jgi:hypothetical protein
MNAPAAFGFRPRSILQLTGHQANLLAARVNGGTVASFDPALRTLENESYVRPPGLKGL